MSFITQLPTVQEYVYVIHATGTNRIKLGYTTNPQGRLAALQTASPFPLQMLACWPGSRARENRLHRYMAQFRQVGEWFEVQPFIGLKLWEIVHKGETTKRLQTPKRSTKTLKEAAPSVLGAQRGRRRSTCPLNVPLGYEVRETSGGLTVYRWWREWVEEKGRKMMRRRYVCFISSSIVATLLTLTPDEQYAEALRMINEAGSKSGLTEA